MQSELRVINEMVAAESGFVDRITNEVAKVIVGQQYMVERILIGLLTGGHVLLEGVPGLAKTLTVKTVSDTVGLDFSRIQFTPDLLPADVMGTTIYNQHTGKFSVKQGPVFANLVLADEINRAPAKVQSALLEAMQENQVTIGDDTFNLPQPFLVLATQNPLEQEGTYPLPEAQVDRFMLKLKIDYPTRDEELEILQRMATTAKEAPLEAVVDTEAIVAARKVVDQVYVDEKIKSYIVDIVHATREPSAHGLDIGPYIDFGASPRASIYLALASKAYAFIHGRGYVTPQDIKSIGADVLRHRVLITYEAEAADITAEDLIQQIFDRLPVP